MSSIPTTPTWQDSGLTATQLQGVAEALGYTSINDPDMPAITELTKSDLIEIGLYTDPAVSAALSSYVNDVVEPVLDEADFDLDPSEMLMAMSELNKELGELGISFAKEGIKIDKEKLKKASADRLEKIKESLEKMIEADKSNKIGKIFTWIGLAVALVAAIAVAVLTAGAASALVGVAIAGIAIALQVANETGAMDKALDWFLGDVCGMEGQKLDDWKMAVQIGIAVVMMIAGICTGVGVSSALKSVEMVTKLAIILSRVAQAGAAVGAAASVGGGIAGIFGAVQGYESTQAMAESKEFIAWIAKLQAAIEQQTAELEQLMEKLNNSAFVMPKETMDKLREAINFVVSEVSGSTGA